MSKYTIDLHSLVDSGYNLGMDKYPIFDENYRATLNKKILDYYWLDEIGQETPGAFKHYLNQTLDLIMPRYNKLYQAQLALVNPLYGVDLTETLSRASIGSSSSQGSTTGANATSATQTEDLLDAQSDTPQNLLSVDDIKGNLWASKAKRSDNTRTDAASGSSSGTSTNQLIGSSTEEYTKRITGNNGRVGNAKLLIEFTRALQNLDLEIIRELRSCFMEVY